MKTAKLSKEMITDIREQVLNGKSKTQRSRETNIPRSTVWRYTRNVPVRQKISPQVIDKIREEVRNGKSKFQTARDYELNPERVLLDKGYSQ